MRRLPLRRVATKSDGACLPRMGEWRKVMQRKRDGLVPVGEILFDRDGPQKRVPQPSPQARHHFTRHCQRKVRRAKFSAGERELGRSELTPLGKCGDAVEREIVP